MRILPRLAVALFLACVGFVAMPSALSEAKSRVASKALILSNTKIGTLELSKDTKLDLKALRKVFAGFTVEKQIGQQDGPDFVYYRVSDSDGELLWIKADDEDSQLLESVHVVSEKIQDQYGLKIGSAYKDVLLIRPRLITETDDHFHTYIGHPKENIVYEMAVSYKKGYQGPDRNPTEQEVADSKVAELIWFVR